MPIIVKRTAIRTKPTPLKILASNLTTDQYEAIEPYAKKMSYEQVYDIIGMCTENFDECIHYISTCNLSDDISIFSSPAFKDQIEDERMYYELLNNPPDVQEGIHTCKKCGTNKTYQFQKQVRGGDEGMDTFVKCANPKCGKFWKLAN